MNILISTFGTRGDIQPFIALGKALKAAGFTVAICTAEGFKPMVEAHGLRYAFMGNELLALTQTALGRKVNVIKLIQQMYSAMRSNLSDEWHSAQAFAPDLMIYHPKMLGSYHIAEKLKIPRMIALPLPFYTPTSAFPNPVFARVRLGKSFNRFSYTFMSLLPVMFSGLTNRFRTQSLGLPRRHRFADLLTDASGQPVPVLYPYSPHVLEVPSDYPPHVHVTGYWFLDQGKAWQPPVELLRFLEAGAPPVYIGFGSMGGAAGTQRAHLVLDALAATGQRGILVSGWGGIAVGEVPKNALVIDDVPHDWLFPQVAAVVHHGGAGTTGAGLRAGKATIICPFLGDQAFWGEVVYRRGVGPRPIPQKRLSVSKLATAITTVLQDTIMQQRAATLGTRIRAEDGVARAVEIIQAKVGVPVG